MGPSRHNDTTETAESALFAPAPRGARLRADAELVAVVAFGGATGACARYGASLLWPTAPDTFPWTTLAVNVTGCAIMGIFMILVTDVWTAHRLLRPFVGTGMMGGYTTFSTYAADIHHLINTDHVATGLVYLALTLIGALTAVWTTAALTRRVITRRTR